jgi:hypothetical protein
VEAEYHFSPDSEWEGQKFSYKLPAQTTEDRTLVANPYDDLGFLEIKVFPSRIDQAVINSVEVKLQYQDSKGWSRKKAMMVTPDSAPQFWKLRLSDPASRSFTYQFVYNLKDGTKRESKPVTTQATAVAVDDPFERPLEVIFIPAFPTGQQRTVFVDVEYHDDQNNYHREERLRIPGDSTEEVKLRLALINPAKRTFRYRFTFVDTDGKVRSKAWVETTETLISVAE